MGWVDYRVFKVSAGGRMCPTVTSTARLFDLERMRLLNGCCMLWEGGEGGFSG